MSRCIRCDVLLTEENWHPSRRKAYYNICKSCYNKEAKKTPKQQRDYKRRNKDKVRFWNQRSKLKNKIEVLSHYANPLKCSMCSEEDIIVLTLDHIDDNGAEERKQFAKEYGYALLGSSFYYWLKKNNYPKGYQVLCPTCQLRKRSKHLYSVLADLQR